MVWSDAEQAGDKGMRVLLHLAIVVGIGNVSPSSVGAGWASLELDLD